MARQPKPWYWKARDAWYVQLGGKQVRLHEQQKEARLEFHRIMAARGETSLVRRRNMTFADACEAYLANHQHHRKATIRNANDKLADLCTGFATRNLEAIRPGEILAWIKAWPGRRGRMGEPTRALLFRWCKQLYKWCRDTGLLDIDPFARASCPWKIRRRTSPMSVEDYTKIMSLPRLAPQFKEVVEFVWRTGIRPGELAILAASHMDATLHCVRFEPSEHKTGSRSGESREVYMPSDLWDRLISYATRHKDGPLLRKMNGKPWDQPEISRVFNRIKVRHGLCCVLYQARHSFATAMLDGGVDRNKVSAMMGHEDPSTISVYYHPEKATLSSEVERIMGKKEADRVSKIKESVEAKKEEQKESARQKDNARRKVNHAKAKAKPTPTPAPTPTKTNPLDVEWDW